MTTVLPPQSGAGTAPDEEWRRKADQLGLAKRDLESPSLTMLVMLATLGVLLYASFLARPSNVGDLLPWAIVILCESIMMLQVLISLWTQLSSASDPRGFAFHNAQRDLFLPAFGSYDLTTALEHGDVMQLDGRPISADVILFQHFYNSINMKYFKHIF